MNSIIISEIDYANINIKNKRDAIKYDFITLLSDEKYKIINIP
jgi:hypothetical protein